MVEQTNEMQETGKQELAQGSAERTRERVAFVPRADIYETNEHIFVVADMPGLSEQNVDIVLEEDLLTIRGYPEMPQPEDYDLTYAEYRVGDYERRFTVANTIDRKGIEATMKDGVLKLKLPKAPEARRRRIPIEVG